MVIKKVEPIESAKLCLDNAIERLQKGNDVRPALFQFCMQLARHYEQQGFEKEAKAFQQRAKIFKKLKSKRGK